MTAKELFAIAGLTVCGPVPWGKPVKEPRHGVYVLTSDQAGTDVVYVGMTETQGGLRKRLGQFYRQRHGPLSTLRGGDRLELQSRYVFWAACQNPPAADGLMLNAFVTRKG